MSFEELLDSMNERKQPPRQKRSRVNEIGGPKRDTAKADTGYRTAQQRQKSDRGLEVEYERANEYTNAIMNAYEHATEWEKKPDFSHIASKIREVGVEKFVADMDEGGFRVLAREIVQHVFDEIIPMPESKVNEIGGPKRGHLEKSKEIADREYPGHDFGQRSKAQPMHKEYVKAEGERIRATDKMIFGPENERGPLIRKAIKDRGFDVWEKEFKHFLTINGNNLYLFSDALQRAEIEPELADAGEAYQMLHQGSDKAYVALYNLVKPYGGPEWLKKMIPKYLSHWATGRGDIDQLISQYETGREIVEEE